MDRAVLRSFHGDSLDNEHQSTEVTKTTGQGKKCFEMDGGGVGGIGRRKEGSERGREPQYSQIENLHHSFLPT